MSIHWSIARIFKKNNDIIIEGYSSKPMRGRTTLLSTTIRPMSLDEFVQAGQKGHEGQTWVPSSPQSYWIEVDLSPVEDIEWIDRLHKKFGSNNAVAQLLQNDWKKLNELQKETSIDCLDLVKPNALVKERYMGLPNLVYSTWIGMIMTDI